MFRYTVEALRKKREKQNKKALKKMSRHMNPLWKKVREKAIEDSADIGIGGVVFDECATNFRNGNLVHSNQCPQNMWPETNMINEASAKAFINSTYGLTGTPIDNEQSAIHHTMSIMYIKIKKILEEYHDLGLFTHVKFGTEILSGIGVDVTFYAGNEFLQDTRIRISYDDFVKYGCSMGYLHYVLFKTASIEEQMFVSKYGDIPVKTVINRIYGEHIMNKFTKVQ